MKLINFKGINHFQSIKQNSKPFGFKIKSLKDSTKIKYNLTNTDCIFRSNNMHFYRFCSFT